MPLLVRFTYRVLCEVAPPFARISTRAHGLAQENAPTLERARARGGGWGWVSPSLVPRMRECLLGSNPSPKSPEKSHPSPVNGSHVNHPQRVHGSLTDRSVLRINYSTIPACSRLDKRAVRGRGGRRGRRFSLAGVRSMSLARLIRSECPLLKGSRTSEHYVSVKIEGAGLDTQFG